MHFKPITHLRSNLKSGETKIGNRLPWAGGKMSFDSSDYPAKFMTLADIRSPR